MDKSFLSCANGLFCPWGEIYYNRVSQFKKQNCHRLRGK
uniref:Uncharacterized protein n=1 Tax=Anguilla anguilla TaxID=7936 RepID=A0A0E9VIR4_ANGAN